MRCDVERFPFLVSALYCLTFLIKSNPNLLIALVVFKATDMKRRTNPNRSLNCTFFDKNISKLKSDLFFSKEPKTRTLLVASTGETIDSNSTSFGIILI